MISVALIGSRPGAEILLNIILVKLLPQPQRRRMLILRGSLGRVPRDRKPSFLTHVLWTTKSRDIKRLLSTFENETGTSRLSYLPARRAWPDGVSSATISGAIHCTCLVFAGRISSLCSSDGASSTMSRPVANCNSFMVFSVSIMLAATSSTWTAPTGTFSMRCMQRYNLADNSLPALNFATFFAFILITGEESKNW